jgi:hypothetical protein
MTDTKTATADYEVTQPREIGGVYRAAGEVITMMPAQAKYYLPPYGAGLKPAAAKAATKPKADAEKPATKGDKAEG